MRKPIQTMLVVAVAMTAMFVAARPVVADPGIGNDAAFPIVGIPANNVLEPVAGAPVFGPLVPPPALRITSLLSPPNPPAFGDVQDISYADEAPLVGPLFVEFSVGPQFGGGMPTGMPGSPSAPPPGLSLRQEAGLFPPAPFGDGSTLSDIFQSVGPLGGPLPCAPVLFSRQILDDDGSIGPFGPRLGLNLPPGVGVGNLDSYDRSEETPTIRPLPATGGAAVAATGVIFFTIDAPTAAGWAAPIPGPGGPLIMPGPGDILAWNPAIAGPVVYATSAALGLIPGVGGDDVDALAVSRLAAAPPLPPFGPGFDFEPPGTAVLMFSLAPGSPSLSPTSGGAAATPLAPGCTPPGTGTAGDLWFVGGPVPVGGAAPYMNAEFLGLATVRAGAPADDDIDAVDVCNGSSGSDIDGDTIDSACDFDDDGDGTGDFIDPDDDGDGFGDPQQTLHLGPANTAAGFDNCPSVPNPAQTNTDGNFVDTSPPYVVAIDDKTWPNSDMFGDACDSDDDNDGLSDADEASGAACAGIITSALLFDSDGDRARDGAECSIGTNPTGGASFPALAACGAAGDADGDKIATRIEFCYYGSSTASTDSDGDLVGGLDGDGGKDGCEIASINADQVVSSGDQGKLASGISGATPYHPGVDLNKDGLLNSGDQGTMASFISPPGQCP